VLLGKGGLSATRFAQTALRLFRPFLRCSARLKGDGKNRNQGKFPIGDFDASKYAGKVSVCWKSINSNSKYPQFKKGGQNGKEVSPMPQGDGTGPLGKGPGVGRGQGGCRRDPQRQGQGKGKRKGYGPNQTDGRQPDQSGPRGRKQPDDENQ
jgi:hypothetical protein